MSENETRLRWCIERTGDADLLAEWDALLAEHRAEVEGDKAWPPAGLAQRTVRALVELLAPEAKGLEGNRDVLSRVRRSLGERGATRDAALEDAAAGFNGLCTDCKQGPVNPEHERCWHEHDSATRIRALKSQPARQYVDAEKVRMVARQILGTRKLVSNPVGAVHDMLEILGLDLSSTDPQP